MTTIYDTQDIKVTLEDDAVTIFMYGIQRVEMTEAEWKMIIKAYQESK